MENPTWVSHDKYRITFSHPFFCKARTACTALQPFVKLFANILYANSTDIYYI
ncbi:MAG: hypothetical protein V8T36_02675 [Ruthenibacterium lactatiformans]